MPEQKEISPFKRKAANVLIWIFRIAIILLLVKISHCLKNYEVPG